MESNLLLSDSLDSMSNQDKDKLEQAIALLSSISGGTQTSSSTSAGSSSSSNQVRVEGNFLVGFSE